MNTHPISEVIVRYLQDFPSLKRDNVDLDNLSFHQQYGLFMDCPQSWPLYEWLRLMDYSPPKTMDDYQNIVVVYSSTAVYNEVSEVVRQKSWSTVEYFSWQEFFATMHMINDDTRPLRELKTSLAKADLVIFLGVSSAIKDVVSQIQAAVNGCLLSFA